MPFRIWNSPFNLSLCLSIAVLSLAKGAMLSGATCAVLCSRDRKRLGVPALAEHRVPRPETREHSLGFTRTHHPDRLRPVQREHRTQWNDINILWNTRGKWRQHFYRYTAAAFKQCSRICSQCANSSWRFSFCLAVFGTWGITQAAVWPDGGLVVFGCSAVWNVIWPGEWFQQNKCISCL